MTFFTNNRFVRAWSACTLLLLFSLSACRSPENPLDALRTQLRAYTDTLDAQVGIALLTEDGDSLTVGNEARYPLMSVYKFHQALAVCHCLQARRQPLDTLLRVSPSELRPDTWSPLREKYRTAGGQDSIGITVRELLLYALQQSDNNACDILFRRYMSPAEVGGWLRERTRLEGFDMAFTEEEMGQQHLRAYENWTTPYAAASLMALFLQTDLVDAPYRAFLKQAMQECRTGTARLPAPLLGTEATIGHKTGSGFVTTDGRLMATNDVGFVSLSPDGPRYVLAVFVKDSGYDEPATEAIIAHVSRLVYACWAKGEDAGL